MRKKTTIYQLTTCALLAALMCVVGPMSLPIGPVPVTLTNFVIYLSVFLLGVKGAPTSVLIYLLLGAVGMPVFSGYQGGLAKLVGPTGGYLVGFVPMALIGGIFMDKSKANLVVTIIGMVVGTAVLYVLGTAWFMLQTGSDLSKAMTLCVTPFLPFDCAKIVLAALFGKVLRRALANAKLLPEAR